MSDIERLYQQLLSIGDQAFYQIEADFCCVLYYGIPEESRPPCVTAFLTVADWFAKSERSGVWTFYEAANPKDIELTAKFLEGTGNRDFASIFRYGIHDYQNTRYAGNYAYPDEWIGESEKIDAWIEQHSNWLYAWERTLLIENQTLICSCCTANLK